MILSVVNQKGRVGKTTAATKLAVCFAKGGQDTLPIDAVSQHSALDWWVDWPEDKVALQVIGSSVQNLQKEIAPFRKKYGVIIIDWGGSVMATARAAVSVADVVCVPALPSQLDVLSTTVFFQSVLEEVASMKTVQAEILVNQVQANTVIAHESREELTQPASSLFVYSECSGGLP
jgi:chromosome partitioning protein